MHDHTGMYVATKASGYHFEATDIEATCPHICTESITRPTEFRSCVQTKDL